MFYPDNAKRATRLQQLVDSMDNMQTDIKYDADDMDRTDTKIRPAIDKLLQAQGYDGIDDLITKSGAQFTPDEKAQFDALIAAAKKSKADFDWSYFAAGLLMVPEGVVLTGKVFVAIGRFVLRLSVIKNISALFKDAAGTVEAASAAGDAAEQAAKEADAEASDASIAGEAGAEVEEGLSLLSKLSNFIKVLGAIGFAVTLIVGIVEAIEGAEQKSKLIDAIHSSQPARLLIAYFKREASNIQKQLAVVQTYLEFSPGGSSPNPAVAGPLAQSIVQNIQADDKDIDWTELETELETQDNSSGSFYGDDDLSRADVVAAAQAKATTS